MGGATHLALVRTGTGLSSARVPTPAVGPGDVLVRVGRVGVCGTDLQILNGTRPDTARVLGHEGIGWVEQVGPGGPPLAAGSHVVFNPVNPARPFEVLGHSFDGLWQEKAIIPAAVVVPADPDLPADLGPLVEPLGTAVYGHELACAAAGRPEGVAVVGGGPVGLLYAIHARAAGAKRVVLIHPSPTRLAWAVAAGIVGAADAVLADATGPPVGVDADVVYLCTPRAGAVAGLRTALAVVRDGGCVDLVAGLPDGASAPAAWAGVDPNEVRRRNVCGVTTGESSVAVRAGPGQTARITGHRGTAAAHLIAAMRVLASDPGAFRRLVTHVVPLGPDAAELVGRMSRGEPPADGGERVKVVIEIGAAG